MLTYLHVQCSPPNTFNPHLSIRSMPTYIARSTLTYLTCQIHASKHFTRTLPTTLDAHLSNVSNPPGIIDKIIYLDKFVGYLMYNHIILSMQNAKSLKIQLFVWPRCPRLSQISQISPIDLPGSSEYLRPPRSPVTASECPRETPGKGPSPRAPRTPKSAQGASGRGSGFCQCVVYRFLMVSYSLFLV